MARSKRSPLYEVLAKSKNPPGWIRPRHGSDGEADGETDPHEEAVEAPAPESATRDGTSRGATSRGEEGWTAPGDDSGEERIFVIDGSVVRLALTSTMAAAVIFALVAVVAAAFWAGRYAGLVAGREQGYEKAQQDLRAEGVDAIELARRGAPATGLFDGIGESPVVGAEEQPAEADADAEHPPAEPEPSAPEPAETVGWTKGYTYVAVQGFHRTARNDALRAQAYLAEHGIDTALVEMPGDWQWELICRRGFNRDDPAGARAFEQFHKRLRQIGMAYWNSGGGYRLEGYPKKLTRDHW